MKNKKKGLPVWIFIVLGLIIILSLIYKNNVITNDTPVPEKALIVIGKIITGDSINQSIIEPQSTTEKEPDYRNAYMTSWYGKPCDNIDFAKAMGYDYVNFQGGMENCPNRGGLHFYMESPDNAGMPVRGLDMVGNYTPAQAENYSRYFMVKSFDEFPHNLATGWYFGNTSFRPLPDFQQERVIQIAINSTLIGISRLENKSIGFLFGGYSWDVPNLEGDLWSAKQKGQGGSQVGIEYWTKTPSALMWPGTTHDYQTNKDGRVAFLVKLFAETRKTHPDMKIMVEPYDPWGDYYSTVSLRSEKWLITGDLMCQEKFSVAFVNDTRIYNTGLITKDRACSTTPDIINQSDHLYIAGYSGINGAWFSYYGHAIRKDVTNYSNVMASFQNIRNIPPAIKLIRAIPGWDNLNDVPLSERNYDSATHTYSSRDSFADMNVVYSRHPKNHKIYAVITNSSAGVIKLKQGEQVVAVNRADQLMQSDMNAPVDLIVNGTDITLRDKSYETVGYIITVA